MPYTAIIAVKSSSWRIHGRCRQCGAPIVLRETDRVLSCAYCRVTLVVTSKSFFRMHLSPAPSLKEAPVYVPYWRFKGVRFDARTRSGVTHRIVDTSRYAGPLGGFPSSLGLRPGTLKLTFATPQTPGHFLKPEQSFREALDVYAQPSPDSDILDPLLCSVLVGETLSLIYAPFTLKQNRVFDAVTDTPIGASPSELEETQASAEDRSRWDIRFLPALCPRCGGDLQGASDSCVLLCSHCRSAWEAHRENLLPISVGASPGGASRGAALPFWRIEADIRNPEVRTQGDLVRRLNLTRRVEALWDEQPVCFYVPAFKAPPHVFLRLSRRLTAFQPEPGPENTWPASPPKPVTLPLSEAVESLKIILASMAVAKRTVFPLLPDMQIKTTNTALLFIPFEPVGRDLYHAESLAGLPLASLRLGKTL